MKILLIAGILLCASCVSYKNDLERFYDILEKRSPPYIINEFKKTPLDSAVIHHDRFNEIFVTSSKEILKDSIELTRLQGFFLEKGIDQNMLDGTDIYWAYIACFHKHLNHKSYDFGKVVDDMQELFHRVNEMKYGRPNE